MTTRTAQQPPESPRSGPRAHQPSRSGLVSARRLARRCIRRLSDDRGSATAEYAIVILAAVAFAGVLVAIMRSGEIQEMLGSLVRGALSQ